ncbi:MULTISPECIES: hypothetical protein [Clostridium]|uniref:hypothetical protein n=1 Tax=Clostridium TaxID=1485 RepID=UPI000D841C52|nr:MULTISPECIES: hypothetical protein [Clostridium]MDB2125524.1 hypothetical protein [Clostridium paraputrificum]MDU6521290.1 hypothetical protein [Clostridium sp.]SQB91029.1 Uncharacterised protein [Clostridium paraputrificum]
MKIFILFCNIIVPVIMICIGVLYNRHSNKRINRILDLFMPIAMIGSGLGNVDNSDFLKGKKSLQSSNKKCGMIWLLSGLVTFIITAIVLIINKSDILNATSFLDTTNVSVIMLEVEFAIVVMAFISVEFVLKKYFYKKND